jgi:hypothetical protein
MTAERARQKWEKNPNRMVIFEPNTCPHPMQDFHRDRWLLADKWGILAIGFSRADMKEARRDLKRRRG